MHSDVVSHTIDAVHCRQQLLGAVITVIGADLITKCEVCKYTTLRPGVWRTPVLPIAKPANCQRSCSTFTVLRGYYNINEAPGDRHRTNGTRGIESYMLS